MEIWKSIIGFEGSFEVSNLGRVRSLNRRVEFDDGRYATYKGKVFKPTKASTGYLIVNLSKNSKVRLRHVHRLVAEAFVENPDNKTQVNHKDGNKENNLPDNLEWVTPFENAKHASDSGLLSEGYRHKSVKQLKKDGTFVASYSSYREAARAVEGNSDKISLVVRGIRKSHKGFIWKEGDNSNA